MKFIGIIPARYASSRFPGKPLADICGKTIRQHSSPDDNTDALIELMQHPEFIYGQ